MNVKKCLKLLVAFLLVLSVVGCTPWTKPRKPDFGEEGDYRPSEKVICYLGGNSGGLSNEAYLARADAAWDFGFNVIVTFDRKIIATAPQKGLSDEENAMLVQVKEQIEALENPGDRELGKIVWEAYSEFLGLKAWRKDWWCSADKIKIWFTGWIESAGELDLTWMTELAESPLIQKIEVEAEAEATND